MRPAARLDHVLPNASRLAPLKWALVNLVLVNWTLVNWCCAVRAEDFFVAPKGNDQWSGTLAEVNSAGSDGPFASLEKARDTLRAKRQAGWKGSATIQLRGGSYLLPRTFQLEKQDSGTKDAPVVYRAFENERPVLIGGKAVSTWTPHEGQILKADLAAQGMAGATFHQIVFRGQRQVLARRPNFDPKNPYGGGWAYADGKPVPMYEDIPGEDRRTLSFKPADIGSWSNPTEGEVFVFPRYNWWNNIARIAGMDVANRKLKLADDCSYAIRPGDRYYVQNIREELDAPGEWYLDGKTSTLYFWPPEPISGEPVFVPLCRTIMDFGAGTEQIQVRGLTFECCEGTAIQLRDARECLIAACTIRNVGDYNGSGVSIDGGSRDGVQGCDIYQTGSHGISLSGGDRKTLTGAEHYADNNYIHHVGVFYKQGVGIALSGVGNRASHNLIHDGPRMGIMFSGNNLRIEYNHIRHVNLETEDTGAVYTGGRDWISSRGTVILGNYFHDILGYGRDGDRWVSPHFAWGIYLDDNTGGVDVIGNIVVRCPRAGLHLHNGRDNRIENNVFVESRLQQIEYSGWTKDHPFWKNHLPTMIEGYEMVANQPAWKGMRNMGVHPRDAVLPDGLIMTGNTFEKNIIYYRGGDAKLFSFHNVPFDHYVSDHNVIWHGGKPLLTGQTKVGKNLSSNLVRNPGFEAGKAGSLPDRWTWQMRPAESTAARVPSGDGPNKFALQMTGGIGKEANGRDFYPQIVGEELPLEPGRNYRLSARMKGDQNGRAATLMMQSYEANAYFWGSYPNEVRVDSEWKQVEFTFKTPVPGESGYHEQMKKFRVRIDYRDRAGQLLIDDVAFHEVEVLDEWSAWQALGFDGHSLVADPLFENADMDDYRLKKESPAFPLGFHAIPVDRIGPYQHEHRASWPIVEAEGAREHPLTPTSTAGP